VIFAPAFSKVTFLRRYKRFLADVRCADGSEMTVHCPNSGSMLSCLGPQWPAAISDSGNSKRKYRYSLEMLHSGRSWIGINTWRSNALVGEAIRAGQIAPLRGYSELRREVKYGENSRIDIHLEKAGEECYVEVKNVTMVDAENYNSFPDAVTLRGRKHLRELINVRAAGRRAVMFFLVQRSDGKGFRPAAHIDPAYAEALHEARTAGVEVLVYQCAVSPREIRIDKALDCTF
jgi:sugar fermentation stimulation protein A